MLAVIPSGHRPLEVVASDDGRTAYISNLGLGMQGEINVVDLATRKLSQMPDSGPFTGAHALTFVDGKLWLTADATEAVARYDPRTHEIVRIAGTEQSRSQRIYVEPGARRIVTLDVHAATLAFIQKKPSALLRPQPVSNTLSGGTVQSPYAPEPHPQQSNTLIAGGPGWETTVIPVGRGSESFDVSPDGAQIWVVNARNQTVSVIDMGSRSVVATFQSHVEDLKRLKFTPDGLHVLVSGLRSPDILVFDARTRQLEQRIPIGRGAAGIVMQPDGKRAYVACTPDHSIAVIDLATLTVTTRMMLTVAPDDLAWASAKMH